MSKSHTFPWGIYIGELSPQNDTADTDDIPVLLPAESESVRYKKLTGNIGTNLNH